MEETIPRQGKGETFTWAVDAMVVQYMHILNDKIVAQVLSATAPARTNRIADKLSDWFIGNPIPLAGKRFEFAVFRAEPVIFDTSEWREDGTSVLLYRSVPRSDSITIARFDDLHLKAKSGPARVRWPDGVFEL